MTQINTSLITSSDGAGETSLSNQLLAKALITNDAESDVIRYSLNISSVTDVGTGDHTANYTSAYSTAYAAVTTGGRISEAWVAGNFQIGYTTYMKLRSLNSSLTLSNSVINGYSFGALA